jgi:hypothetical protein
VKKQLKKIAKAWTNSRWSRKKNAIVLEMPGSDVVSSEDNSPPSLNAHYATLIGEAILQRPKKRRSAKGICKDIMKQHEWYNINRHGGWQVTSHHAILVVTSAHHR